MYMRLCWMLVTHLLLVLITIHRLSTHTHLGLFEFFDSLTHLIELPTCDLIVKARQTLIVGWVSLLEVLFDIGLGDFLVVGLELLLDLILVLVHTHLL